MAKKHPARKRRAPHRSATRRPGAARPTVSQHELHQDPLMTGLREALREPNPIAFWAEATSVVVLLDEPGDWTDTVPEGIDLLQTFIDVDIAETTALLHMVAAMSKDDLKRARARNAVRERRQPVPPHISGLAELVVTSGRVFGDYAGDNHLLELALPGEVRVTLVAYVQRRPQAYLKDAFFIPDRLETVEGRFRTMFAADGVSTQGAIRSLDPADSRRALEDALAGSDVVPVKQPEDGDQWPMSRPLVEFVLSRLPEGGAGYGADGYIIGQDQDDLLIPSEFDFQDEDVDEDWLDDPFGDGSEVLELVGSFLASPQARALGGEDDLDPVLAAALLSLASMAEGDPLHWCGMTTRWVLEEALPRSPLLMEPEVVERATRMVPLLVAWAHEESGEDPDVVEEVRAVLPQLLETWPDRWAAQEMEVARLDAVAEIALMTGDPDVFVPVLLQQRVGGAEALDSLDTDPLPVEPLVLDEVPQDLHAKLAEIDAALVAGLAAVDTGHLPHFDPVLDEEFLTACRRFLVQAAVGDPEALRGRASVTNTAAAVAWVIGRGNGLVGGSGPLRATDLMRAFGAKSNPSQRAARLQEAAVLPHAPEGEMLALGSPRLLLGAARQDIWEQHQRAAPS